MNGNNDTMKAAVLYATNDLRYEEYPMPQVRPGTVKVRVRACGICGSDVPRVHSDTAFVLPIVLGHEFAGDVTEVGEGVTSVKVGDTVVGACLLPCFACDDCQQGHYASCLHYKHLGSWVQGAFSDYIVIPERNAVSYDPSIPYEQAAMFEPCTVAIHGVRRAGFIGGGTVAIIGGGTVGTFVTQWVRLFGASQVVVFDVDDDRLDTAMRYGAGAVINTSLPGCVEKAAEHTGGRFFDYVFETAGTPVTMSLCLELAAIHGTICFIGYPPVPATFQPSIWHKLNRKELTILGSNMSYTPPFPGLDWTLTARFVAEGKIKCDEGLIYRKFEMKDAVKAFDLFRPPSAVKGKILLCNDLDINNIPSI